MLFSVLIPLYNAEKYFSECLDSVLAQNFDDFEIVIADDGSTDNSGAIADEYQKKHPKCIRVIHKENSGVLLTRRRLMKESRGEYIIWVDADDVIKPNLMESLHREIISKSPDVIIYNYEMFDKPEKIVRSLPLSHETMIVGNEKHAVYTKMLLDRDMNALVTKCYKRDLVDVNEDYSKYKDVKMGDDLFCLIPVISAAKKIEYIDISYYRYRMVDASITHTNTYLSYYSYRTIYERELDYAYRWGFTDNEIDRLKNKFAYRFIDCLVSYNSSSERSYKGFKKLAVDIWNNENNHPIFMGELRFLPSKVYQHYYQFFIKKHFWRLYIIINVVSVLSRIKKH